MRQKRAAAIVLALIAAIALGGCSGSSGGATNRQLAIKDATSFLSRYVDSDGRVVRRDQGSDTVSEGQGYGLLMAFVTNERQRFAAIWSWTKAHLQQSNGLFAFHWSGGNIASATPAADADTQIAWALVMAGNRWRQPSYISAAKQIAGAIAQNEIGYDATGRPTLTAGPWAIRPAPPTVEPGYWTYPADNALAAITGDNRWKALAAADLTHLQQVSENGKALPPDWAREGSSASASSLPGGSGGQPVSGQDGMRAMVWAACTPGGRALDRQWWTLVRSTASQAPLVRALSGAPVNHDASPLAAVAAAAAAEAASQVNQRNSLLDDADHIDQQYPTYYGSAWAALGRIVLVPGLLPGCG